MAKKTEKTKQKREPKPRNSFVFDLRRPFGGAKKGKDGVEVDLGGALALEFGKAVAEGKNPSPNKAVMSGTAFALAYDSWADDNAEGEFVPPSVPALYQPLVRQAARATRALAIVPGHESKHPKSPKNWPENVEFTPGDHLVEVRICHSKDARKLVADADQNILKINKHEYVVGTTETPAVFLVNGSKTGAQGASILAGKQLSFEGVSGIKNLVGRFNPDYHIQNIDDGTDPGAELAWGSNMRIDAWGTFERDNKEMTPAQIRKAVESGENKGMKFVPLKEPIVGHSITEADLWRVVKKRDAKPNYFWKGITEAQTRIAPHEQTPLGIANGQTLIAPCIHYGESLKDERLRFVIGVFCGTEYTENKWQAGERLGEKISRKPKTEKIDKPKTEKKREKKSTKKTTKKSTKAVAKKAAPKKDKSKKSTKSTKKSTKAEKEPKKVTKETTQPATEAASVVQTLKITTPVEDEIDKQVESETFEQIMSDVDLGDNTDKAGNAEPIS